MAMLTILLCASVFMQVAEIQCFSLDSFVSSIPIIGPIKDDIEYVVDEGINTLETDLQKVVNISEHVVGELENAASSVVTKLTNSIKSIIKEMSDGLEVLFTGDEKENVSTCLRIPATVVKNSWAIITNVTSCVTDKVEQGFSYVNDIATKIYDSLKDFYNLKDNIEKCKDRSGILSSLTSPLCGPLISGEAVVGALARIPGGAIDLAELTGMILTLIFTIPSCMAVNLISSISTDAHVAVATTKQCLSEIF